MVGGIVSSISFVLIENSIIYWISSPKFIEQLPMTSLFCHPFWAMHEHRFTFWSSFVLFIFRANQIMVIRESSILIGAFHQQNHEACRSNGRECVCVFWFSSIETFSENISIFDATINITHDYYMHSHTSSEHCLQLILIGCQKKKITQAQIRWCSMLEWEYSLKMWKSDFICFAAAMNTNYQMGVHVFLFIETDIIIIIIICGNQIQRCPSTPSSSPSALKILYANIRP